MVVVLKGTPNQAFLAHGQVVTAMYISNEAAGLKGPLDLLGQFIAVSYASNGVATFEKEKIQHGKKKIIRRYYLAQRPLRGAGKKKRQ